MKVLTVPKTKFKPRAFEYFRRVARDRQVIRVTDRGRPVAEIVPCGAQAMRELRALRGMVVRYEDPLAPVGETWDAER